MTATTPVLEAVIRGTVERFADPCLGAVVHAADVEDVRAAVRFAGAEGAEVVVRGSGLTGPRPAGNRPRLVLDTSALLDLEVRADGTARVGAGVRWGALLAAAPGLLASAGTSPDVTVVGYLGGGGLGPLARTLGFASDAVTAVEVVTGDGELRRATATTAPGLFWALRGGKGALGVVVAVELRLVPEPPLVAGTLRIADPHAWSLLHEALPRTVTTSLVLDGTDASVQVVAAGDGVGAVGPLLLGLRAEGAPPGPTPFARLTAALPRPASGPAVTVLVDRLDPGTVSALVAAAAATPGLVTELRPLGGAIAAPDAPPAAIDHRDAAALLTVWGPARAAFDAVRPWTSGRTLPSSAPWTDAAAVARHYSPAVLARLGALVATYDPAGVLAEGGLVRRACATIPSRAGRVE